MTASHDKSYIYEAEAFATSKYELAHTKIVMLQLYVDDLKSQAKEAVTQLQNQIKENPNDETLQQQFAKAKEKLEQYDLLANKFFKLVSGSAAEQDAIKDNILKEQKFEAHNFAAYIAGKSQFEDQFQASDQILQENNSNLNQLINENRELLKFPGKGFPTKSQLISYMKNPEAIKQVSNAYERSANISKEMQCKAIQKDSMDLSARYALNTIALAQISLNKTLEEQTKKFNELAKNPQKKAELDVVKTLKANTEKNLKNLEKIKSQIQSLQDQMKKASIFKRKKLGDELIKKLKAAAFISASFYKSEDINGSRLQIECNYIDNARKMGISSGVIRTTLKLIEQAENNILLFQEKLKTSPGDLQALAYHREIEKLKTGILNVTTATSTKDCAAANKAFAATVNVTNAMLHAIEAVNHEKTTSFRTRFHGI